MSLDPIKFSLTKIAELPRAKVDRIEFLQKKLRKYCDVPEKLGFLETQSPTELFGDKVVSAVSKECISRSVLTVTSISAATGLPGGVVGLVGGMGVDLTQYLYNAFILAQQLAYLHGYRDFWNDDVNPIEDSMDVLKYYVGVLAGVSVTKGVNAGTKLVQETAKEVLEVQAKVIAERTAANLAKPAKGAMRAALNKVAQSGAGKAVAVRSLEVVRRAISGPFEKIMGKTLSREAFAKGASKAVPVVGALIAGGITYATYKPNAWKLLKKLEEEEKLRPGFSEVV